MGKWGKVLLVVGLLLSLGVGGLALRANHYQTRIYPAVSVAGMDIGGLPLDAAVALLNDSVPAPEAQWIDLLLADKTWRVPWSTVGYAFDVEATVQSAYAVERAPNAWLALWSGIGHDPVSLEFVKHAADPVHLHAYLQQIAALVYVPPVNADLQVSAAGIAPTAGQLGQHLDVETSARAILAALEAGAAQVSLSVVVDAPKIAEPQPAYGQVQALLAQPFILSVADPLTGEPPLGYRAELSASQELLTSWFDLRQEGEAVKLYLDAGKVRAWLLEVQPQLGTSREFDLGPTLANVLEALYAGESQAAAAALRHPQHTYYVQPGEYFFDIAYVHRFTQWQLERVNPDVDPSAINAGMALTIPSLDVLFPYPLVPGKRIEVDLPAQTVQAYENDKLVFDFMVSSGMSTTPTIAGQFQVLFKEENAFARRWHLDMPYFMGIYEEREGFFNGFHELPVTEWGTQLSRGVLGSPASFGCLILDNGDAQQLFDWAPVGTLVRITGVAPGTPSGQETLADIAPLIESPQP